MAVKDKTTITCDQCNDVISQDDDRVVFALNKGFHLCSRCAQELVINYRDAIERHKLENSLKKNKRLTPSSIKAFLDKYVIGQDNAKMILSNAVYNHYKTIRYKQRNKDNKDAVELDRSNILLCGTTGSGKSYLIKTIAKFLSVPYTIETATSLSQTGFIGRDVESIIQTLVENATGKDITERIQKAEVGIVYIDEFDKLSRKGESPSIGRDVSGEGVQQGLLKIIEGSIVEVPITRGQRITPTTQTVKVNTENILFICGGSFEGIEPIIRKRLHQSKGTLGFGAALPKLEDQKANIMLQVKTEDFKKFGMIPEILGRLPIICPLEELTVDHLVKILTLPKNALISQYQELFKMENSKLVVTDQALTLIAQQALSRKTGARALRSILEDILQTTMFDLPEHPATVTISTKNDDFIVTKTPIV